MAIEYAGGTRVNYTFTDAGTRADLVAKLETQLGTAGWSTISGGGSADVLMKSAVTPGGLSVRLRLLDPGSGNCAQFTIKNDAGTLTSQICYLLPGSVEWRIVANKYWFMMFRTGAANRGAARGTLFAGTIWAPQVTLDVMGSDLDCGFLLANGISDTDATARPSWRSSLSMPGTFGRGSSLFRSFMVDVSANATFSQPILKVPLGYINSAGRTALLWEGDGQHQDEAVIGWSPDGTSTTRAKWKGQLFDAMILSSQLDGETTISFDTHNWIVITDLGDISVSGNGTLCMAIT